MVKKKTKKERILTPIRNYILRIDSSIEAAQKTIEEKLALPKGSVKLVYPSGRKARADSTVGALVKNWDNKG